MQATISGETRKVDVFDRSFIDAFNKEEKLRYLKLKNKSALYQNKTLIKTTGLNYLNLLPEDKVAASLKNLILREYNICESMYPYMGDAFLELFFDQKIQAIKTINRFEKRNQVEFIESLTDTNVKNILKWMFDNINLERSLNIQTHRGNNIAFEIEDNFSLRLSYDYDFYNTMSNTTFRNYKFIIIDGYIESIGEIYHLFTRASETKVPYVIFCYGMSEEVKHNIIVNNKKGAFSVLPVSLDVNDENTLNVLNDIAVLHCGEVISSNTGQTISQEVRKELKTGNKISFFKGGIYLEPVANHDEISMHKKFLIRRLDEAELKQDVNTDPIKNRIKNFSIKRLNIFIPELLANNNTFKRDTSYAMSFLRNIDKRYKVLKFGKRLYYIPENYFKIMKEKVSSIQGIMNDIEVILA